jgi:hypothetical protein
MVPMAGIHSGILEAASPLVPEDVVTENDITVAGVWDHLAHDEWEVALDLLQELRDVRSLSPGSWEALDTRPGSWGWSGAARRSETWTPGSPRRRTSKPDDDSCM